MELQTKLFCYYNNYKQNTIIFFFKLNLLKVGRQVQMLYYKQNLSFLLYVNK